MTLRIAGNEELQHTEKREEHTVRATIVSEAFSFTCWVAEDTKKNLIHKTKLGDQTEMYSFDYSTIGLSLVDSTQTWVMGTATVEIGKIAMCRFEDMDAPSGSDLFKLGSVFQ